MSELIKKNDNRTTIRWKLLTGVSALALTATVSSAAADTDRPQLWIELGGQMEHLSNSQGEFSPPFFSQASPTVLAPMVDVQKPAPNSFGENGKITFAPDGSDWLFSASLRYGRSSASKHKHYESDHPIVPFTSHGVILSGTGLIKDQFGDGQGGSRESHLILDFQAGKDIGLGLFGKDSKSVLSAGVRFAQFTSSSHVTLRARPVYVSLPAVGSPGKYSLHSCYFQSNTALVQSKRNTHAVGPSISWDASVPFAGNAADMEVTFDWGVNAAMLFGRQRARVHHQTQGYYFKGLGGLVPKYTHNYSNSPPDQNRSRNVTIPNVGGFASLSLKLPNAKVSIGYRADYFFGAMDTGFDTRKSTTLGFNGPFASISIGLGD